jgi:hypothetical protein
MANSIPPFKHRRLDVNIDEIRLLELLPTVEKTHGLQFKLRHFPIYACPPYIAVSYRWGTSPLTKAVTIDGGEYHIREVVFDLFIQLQLMSSRIESGSEEFGSGGKQTSRTSIGPPARATSLSPSTQISILYWVDSICIDQGNVEERNHQVTRMRAVYSGAQIVYAWLGPATEKTSFAMNFIRYVNVNRRWVINPGEQQSLGPGTKARDALIALFNHGYWRRIWIVQEVVLPKDCLILCGNRSLWAGEITRFIKKLELANTFFGEKLGSSVYDLVHDSVHNSVHDSVYDSVYDLGSAPPYQDLVDSYPGRLLALRERWKNGESVESESMIIKDESRVKGISFNELIDRFWNHETTDPKDAVYGLMGLSEEQVDIDYRKEVEAIYNDVHTALQVRNSLESTRGFKSAFDYRLRYALGLDGQIYRRNRV